MEKQKWYRKHCDGCKSYNPEYRQGLCSIYPYKKNAISEKEKYDTS